LLPTFSLNQKKKKIKTLKKKKLVIDRKCDHRSDDHALREREKYEARERE